MQKDISVTLRKVALVGLGALGSEFARLLLNRPSGVKVRSLLFIDPEPLEARNVTLSPLYQQIVESTGVDAFCRPKAHLLQRWFASAGVLHARALPCEVGDIGWQQLAACDLLVSCTDNALARAETAFAAQYLGIPMLDGALAGAHVAEGRVSWYASAPRQACYLCNMADDRRAELLSFATSPSLGCSLASDTISMGSAPNIPSHIHQTATVMLQLLQQHQADRSRLHSFALRLHTAEAGHVLRQERLTLQPSAHCPWHEDRGELITCNPDQPFLHALLQLEGTQCLELPWPVCLLARCRACGQQQQRTDRLSFLRRRAACLHCGAAATLHPLQTVAHLTAQHPQAHCTPRQLGLGETHLYFARPILHFQPSTPMEAH